MDDSPTFPTLDSKAVDLITADFRKMYDVYLFQLNERSTSLRYYIAIASAPFIILSGTGFVAALKDNWDPSDTASILKIVKSVPSFIFLAFLFCGGAGIVVFRTFWAAHCELYKITRYMNNFRKLYNSYFHKQFEVLGWELYIESDPETPIPGKIKSWTTPILISMLIINTSYISVGYFLFRAKEVSIDVYIIIALLSIFSLYFHISIYNRRRKDRGRDEPSGIKKK